MTADQGTLTHSLNQSIQHSIPVEASLFSQGQFSPVEPSQSGSTQPGRGHQNKGSGCRNTHWQPKTTHFSSIPTHFPPCQNFLMCPNFVLTGGKSKSKRLTY